MIPKVIDLFSGCGGLSLGFEKAGFEIAGGIELMPEACKTISYNQSWRYGKDENHICGDITELGGDILKDRFGKEGCIVIGGPPCQAYSLAGRAKLKSLGEGRVHTNDKRGFLYQDFLRFVYALDAKAVVMENVPESTDYGGKNIPAIVCDDLSQHGYDAFWTVLNSADYGVPQVRERIFVLAIKKNSKKKVSLPIPTHKSQNLLSVHQSKCFLFEGMEYYRLPEMNEKARKTWVTTGEALSDLPSLFPSETSKYKLLQLNIVLPYKTASQNEFQDIMRSWYGEKTKMVSGNAFHQNKRDYKIFARMKPGDNYLDASAIADELFKRELGLYRYEVGSEEYLKLKKSIVPPYDRNNFVEKWKRLDQDKPSHTLVAHTCNDTYSHIHPWEPRGISVREAARIQSFPDDYVFNCTMGSAFKQIGNAVPPLLAYNIALKIKEAFV